MRNIFSDFDSKYEPKTLADIVFHSALARETVEGLADGSFGFPSTGVNGILLYGVAGTGKSALAKILPNIIEQNNGGEIADVTYVNVAQGGDNGATVIERIKSQTQLMVLGNAFHYFVLDEVDNLRNESMSSLKVAMNTGVNNSIFVLTTNHFGKVDDAVANRCIAVEFNAAESVDWLPKVREVLADYGVTGIDDKLLLDIIEPCEGSARKILTATRMLIAKRIKRAA
jgi:replication-associated recombination protein RarA